jgi:hypothetical protein
MNRPWNKSYGPCVLFEIDADSHRSKVPRQIIVGEPPNSNVGKILRRQLPTAPEEKPCLYRRVTAPAR